MAEMTYLEAISDGLREEMRRDEAVFCLGEDIGAFGGAFKVTDGFVEEFGAGRVLDAPLAESAIIGAAIGVSRTRSAPNSSNRPAVTLKAPPKAPTSSPSTTTRSSAAISFRSAAEIAFR